MKRRRRIYQKGVSKEHDYLDTKIITCMSYGSLDYFVFVSLDSEQSEEESLEEGDVSDDVSEPVGDENGSEETVEETGGDSAQISQEFDEEESEEPDDNDDDEVNTVERKKSAKEGH